MLQKQPQKNYQTTEADAESDNVVSTAIQLKLAKEMKPNKKVPNIKVLEDTEITYLSKC